MFKVNMAHKESHPVAILHMHHNFNVYRCCLSVFVLLINTASAHFIAEGVEGGSIFLQCVHKNVDLTEEQLEVHWRHNDIRNVYDIMHGKISVKEQHFAYKNRASVVLEKCKTGNFSLKLENLRRSDGGMYLCFVPAVNVFQNVELVVTGGIGLKAKTHEDYRSAQLRSHGTDTRLSLIPHLIPVFGIVLHIIYVLF